MRTCPLPLLAALAASGCHEPRRSVILDSVDVVRRDPIVETEAAVAGDCASFLDDEEADVVRAVGDGSVLYANAQVGLVIVDVRSAAAPLVRATSPFVGDPLGVFAVGDVAVVVYAPWDRDPETAVRAVRRSTGETIGELVLRGRARSVRRASGVLVLARDARAEDGRMETAVSTVGLSANGPILLDERRLSGGGAVMAGSPHGVAVARPGAPELGESRTEVTWLGVDAVRGALVAHGTFVAHGVVSSWRGAGDPALDVSEDAHVRVVTCATAACPEGDAAIYTGIDFGAPDAPRALGSSVVARAGTGAFGFSGSSLVVARPTAARERINSEIAVFRTEGALVPLGAVEVAGTIASVRVRTTGTGIEDVVAVGFTGSTASGKRAVLHVVDLRQTPKLAGTTAFGGDWTWSPAYDDHRALSFDPTSLLAALPMTTVRGESGGATLAVQLFSVGHRGARAVSEARVDTVDRLLFVDGRLLAFSADGIHVLGPAREELP